MKNGFALHCKLFPASPLVPVKGHDGSELRFETREAAEAERRRLSGLSSPVAGGGPYYFVVEV